MFRSLLQRTAHRVAAAAVRNQQTRTFARVTQAYVQSASGDPFATTPWSSVAPDPHPNANVEGHYPGSNPFAGTDTSTGSRGDGVEEHVPRSELANPSLAAALSVPPDKSAIDDFVAQQQDLQEELSSSDEPGQRAQEQILANDTTVESGREGRSSGYSGYSGYSSRSAKAAGFKKWTPDEIEQLKEAIKQHGSSWATISREVFSSSRSQIACEMKYMQLVWNDELTAKLDAAKRQYNNDYDTIAREVFDSQWTARALMLFRPPGKPWTDKPSTSKPWTDEMDLKLLNAVADYGENWRLISEQVYRWAYKPMQLMRRYQLITASKHQATPKAASSTPRWTTTEIAELGAAAEKYNKDWTEIANEVYKGTRSPLQLQKKWESLQAKPPRHQQKHDEQIPRLMTPDGQLSVNNDQLYSYLGRELDRQWSRFAQMLGPHVDRLQLTYETPVQPSAQSEEQEMQPWSKEENEKLFAAARKHNNDWTKVAEELPGRSIDSIKSRYGMIWSADEITKFDEALEVHSTDWSKVAESVGTKSPGQCWWYWRRSRGSDLQSDASPVNNAERQESQKPQWAQIMVELDGEAKLKLNFVRTNDQAQFVR